MVHVEIYTKSNCSYCIRAKRLLDSKGIAYEETSLDFGGAGRQEMLSRANGRATVPQIFIDGRHVGGCDDLMMLEYEGKLDTMLTA